VKNYIMIVEDLEHEFMQMHVAADPTTLRELQTAMLIECQKKGVKYVKKLPKE